MKSPTSTARAWRLGLIAIAALAFSVCRSYLDVSPARAQTGEAPEDVQSKSDAVDAAQEALDAATQQRDELESEGAPQDQIDAANQAIAQARAEKDAAEQAAQAPDDTSGDSSDDTPGN